MRLEQTTREPGDIPYDELVGLVVTHHNPKPSVIVQRFKFHSHFRKQGQSVTNFVAELWQLSEHCDFGTVLEDMLRDRLVCGINNDAIQRRFLGETPPLTFKTFKCFRCGGAHYANDCKLKDAVCHACNKKGHLAKKCRISKGKGKPGLGKTHQAQATTHTELNLEQQVKTFVTSSVQHSWMTG